MKNKLILETSPYLKQHASNPVHWLPWGDEAFALARETGKPILFSSGYSACHWCHVMAHESFEDETTAKLMNQNFINIKLDREERPDIDALYQSVLGMMGVQGGWPMTMFLTPDLAPFFGGTYFPSTRKYGMPSFTDVLTKMADFYAHNQDAVQKNIGLIRDELDKRQLVATGDEEISLGLLDRIAEHLLNHFDMKNGGLNGAPKFPQVTMLEQLWRFALRKDHALAQKAVMITLENICQGGIYDHLGGGFARYSVDEAWLVPHFEKMLYDNAQLIQILSLVYQKNPSQLFSDRIAETIHFLTRDMQLFDGGFASALDADSEGHEGKYYVWSLEEVEDALGSQAASFGNIYDVSLEGNFEGRSILNRLNSPLGTIQEEAILAECRDVLLELRSGRIAPERDHKMLTDWNGLVIKSIAFAAWVFDRSDWLKLAEENYKKVKKIAGQKDGRLTHSYCDGQAKHAGLLDDYAFLIAAAIQLFETTGKADYLKDAQGWTEILEQDFADPAGGYFNSNAPEIWVRSKKASDQAIPSGNSIQLQNLIRLYHLTGEVDYDERAQKMLNIFGPDLYKNFFPASSLINGVELNIKPIMAVILGEPSQFENVFKNFSLPNLILLKNQSTGVLHPSHSAFAKEMMDGRPTLYLCHGQTCSPPITDASHLQNLLEKWAQ